VRYNGNISNGLHIVMPLILRARK